VPGIARYLVPSVPAQLLLVACGLTALARWISRAIGPRWGLALAAAAAICGMLWAPRVWSPSAAQSLFKEQRPTALALSRIVEVARPGDLVTVDLETRWLWLLHLEPGIDARGLRSLVARPDLERPGRLLILSQDRPLSHSWWSDRFEVESIGGPRYRERLFLLASDRLPAGEGVLRGPIEDYLRGYLEASAGDPRWGSWKRSRQQLIVGWAHQLLGRLATDPQVRSTHASQARHYLTLSEATQRGAGAQRSES
jgi:hypothetical protein